MSSKAMRLNKYLALAGLGSRRKVEELIKNGKVKINGQVVTDLATTVNSEKDAVAVNNYQVKTEKKVYILLNKPPGYVTTVSDEMGRRTIMELVGIKERIFPVGRLDKNSRGLLIMTNDGDFANRILHPSFKIEKVYEVTVDKILTAREIEKFSKGIFIESRKTAPAQIKLIENSKYANRKAKLYKVILKEGRKRQIRNMFEVLGHKVLDLKRVRVGPLTLANLKESHWRFLTKKEINSLTKISS